MRKALCAACQPCATASHECCAQHFARVPVDIAEPGGTDLARRTEMDVHDDVFERCRARKSDSPRPCREPTGGLSSNGVGSRVRTAHTAQQPCAAVSRRQSTAHTLHCAQRVVCARGERRGQAADRSVTVGDLVDERAFLERRELVDLRVRMPHACMRSARIT